MSINATNHSPKFTHKVAYIDKITVMSVGTDFKHTHACRYTQTMHSVKYTHIYYSYMIGVHEM